MRRRSWIRQFALAAAALALLVPQTAIGQAQRGGTVVHAVDRACNDTLNMHLTTNTPCRMVARHVLDNLVAVNPQDGTITPWLAESWETSAGGRIYTFRLRRGVRFHDGTPFNAEAVKFNFDYTPRRTPRYDFMGAAKFLKAEAVDEYTLRVIFSDPHGPFLINLSDGRMGIDSPAALRRLGDDYGNKGLVGSGPFRFVEWIKGDRVVLERNPDYRWGARTFGHAGPAHLDRLIYRDMPEDGSRAAAVETGEVAISQITEPHASQLRDKPNVRIALVPKAGTSRILMFNVARGPTTDVRVRRAIGHAINKPLLIKLPAWANIGRPATAVLPRNMVPKEFLRQYDRLAEFDQDYDLDRARRLLDEAGWRPGPDGIRMRGGERLALDHVIIESDVIWSQPLQAMLRQAGVDLRFRPGDFNFWVATMRRGEFASTIMSASGYEPTRLVIAMFKSGQAFNYWGYQNVDLERILDAGSVSTTDEDRWTNVLAALRIVNQNALGIMAWEQDYVFAVRSNVEGLQFNEVGFPYFATTWLRAGGR
jgi:peptide/nickel transport system substrate-binding protein